MDNQESGGDGDRMPTLEALCEGGGVDPDGAACSQVTHAARRSFVSQPLAWLAAVPYERSFTTSTTSPAASARSA